MDLKEILSKLPDKPGIYLMKDEAGKVIYVGKALCLKKRVKSYFQKNFDESPRVAAMVSRVRNIEWKLADSEAQALMMESNAIKTLKPRYNVVLKDDKSYPYLRFTDEDYPRLEAVRRPYYGRGKCFGPFIPSDMHETLRLIHELFPLRYCEGSLKSKKPCIYYEMHRCLAPCIAGQVGSEDYTRMVAQVKLFLTGKKIHVLKEIEKRMWEESAKQHFEAAATLRDRLEKARRVIEQQNAATHLRQREGEMADRPSQTRGLLELRRACFLPKLSRHIEAFDISHLQGALSVASMVVFKDGLPNKQNYRKYRIKTVKGIDDFASMAEVVERRYRRLLNESKAIPDLVLVDGGKGQLREAVLVLKKLGLSEVPVISLAKREEHVFLPDRPDPVVLPRQSAGLHLLQWIRDEAHRFAITYHKALRSKGSQTSILDDLASVGTKRKQQLLRYFGSVTSLQGVSIEAIQKVPGFSKKLAGKIFDFLHVPKRNGG